MVSPLTRKRLRSFRRNRRAWWSLLAFGAIFVFCLCADWVCPCDPQAVVDHAALEKYREPVVERSYEVRTARYNRLDSGEIVDFEGPEEVKALVESNRQQSTAIDGYRVREAKHPGYTRVYLEPKEAPKVTERVLPPVEVSFPFRPVPEHPFGIDAGGRDVYARVVHGMRIALVFGIVLAFLGMLFGLVIGAIEGYFGGKTDIVLPAHYMMLNSVFLQFL